MRLRRTLIAKRKGPRPLATGLEGVRKLSEIVRAIVFNVAGATLAVALAFVGWQQLRDSIGRDLIDVVPFEVPDKLAKQGTSGELVAADIARWLRTESSEVPNGDRIDTKNSPLRPYDDVTLSNQQVNVYTLTSKPAELDVKVPGTGLSHKDFVRALRMVVASGRIEITGNVTQTADGFAVRINVLRPGSPSRSADARFTGRSLRQVTKDAAKFAAFHIAPYALIKHDLTVERRRCVADPPCDFREGIQQIRRMLNQVGPKEIASAYVAWCYALGVSGDYKGASEKCRFATQVNAYNDIALQNWGMALNQSGEFSLALEKFQAAIRLNGKNAAAYYGSGDALWRLNRHSESLEMFEAGAKVDPHSNPPYLAWGSRLLAEKKHIEGLDKLRKATDQNPLDAEAWRLLAVAHSMLHQLEPEIDAWRNAIELHPSDPTAYEQLGHALIAKAHYEEAVKFLRHARALRKPGNDLLSSLGLGLALFRLNKYEEAIDVYRHSLSLKQTADAHENIALALSYLHRDIDALEEYEAASREDPTRESIYTNWADSLLSLHRYDESIAKSNKAIELDPRSNIAYLNRAHARLALRDLDAAISDYQKATELDDKFAGAYQGWGDALLQQGRNADAAKMHRKAEALAGKALPLGHRAEE